MQPLCPGQCCCGGGKQQLWLHGALSVPQPRQGSRFWAAAASKILRSKGYYRKRVEQSSCCTKSRTPGTVLPQALAAGQQGGSGSQARRWAVSHCLPGQRCSALARAAETKQMLQKLLPSTDRLHLVTAGRDAHGKIK